MASLKVLVTGGAGFVGCHVVGKLVEEGCEVVVLDDLSSSGFGNIQEHVACNQVKFVEGSILDIEATARAVNGVDAVVHLAAIISVPFSFARPTATMKTNVSGTEALLDECAANGVKKLVYASSCAVYGEAEYTPIDEAHPTNPMSPYAESKLAAEQLIFKDYSEKLQSVALRLFNVYGPRQASGGYAGVITLFKEMLRVEQPLVLYGDGLQTRDFVHVSDVANAFWLALNSESAGVFNVCSGKPVTIKRLAEVMAELAGKRYVKKVFKEPREGDIRHSHGTYAKANEAFKYEPSMSLRSGLSELMVEVCPALLGEYA